MRKLFILFIISLFISACTLKKVEKHHGIFNLKKKSEKLQLFQSNTNDTIIKLGVPSTKSTFDNDVWIYLERKLTSSELKTLGKEKLLLNNVLVLEFDNKGILVKKKFLSVDEMNDIKVSADATQVLNKKKSYVKTFMRSIIQKINDPLGVKKAK
jgi:outer membrane protein assembly factor BamE (lipoprotein component of BamABCDE complex)